VSTTNVNTYVQEQLRKGYSRKQIEQALKQSGYSQSAIAAAFGNPLVSYVQQYLDKGYTAVELRHWLLQQGYPAKQVDEALHQPKHHVHHVAGESLAKIFIVIFLAGVIVVGSYFGINAIFYQSTALLDFSLDSENTLLQAGDDVSFYVNLVNLGAGRFDVVLTHSLIGPNNEVLDKKEETLAVETSARVLRTLKTPKGLPAGRYVIKSEADYAKQEAIASFEITVTSEVNTQPPITPPTNNPPSNNPTPPSPPVIPPTNTPPVLPTATNEFTQTLNKVKTLGSSQPTTAIGWCNDLPEQAQQATCHFELAKVVNQHGYCDAIPVVATRDACYFHFMNQGEYGMCNQFSQEETQELCSQLFYYKTISTYAQNNETTALYDAVGYEPGAAQEANTTQPNLDSILH